MSLKKKFKKAEHLNAFNYRLSKFPRVYESINRELATKEFIVELEYRSVLLIEDMIGQKISKIFNSEV